MPKSTKRFLINDNSLNEFGFRVMTEGVDLSQFTKNPIMLYMHFRPWKGTKDEILPLGRIEDLTVEGESIYGIPFFDDNDEFAMSIYHKVESDFIKMVSGGFKPLVWSDEPDHLLPGQTRSTLLKSQLREVSICDIGANNNALALYDENDEMVNLSDKSKINIIPLLNTKQDMTVELKDVAAELKLTDITAEAILAAVKKIQKENSDLTTENTNLKTAQNTTAIETLLNDAVTAGKITAAQKPQYETLAQGNLEAVSTLLKDMPTHKTIQEQLKDAPVVDGVEALRKLSWEQLDESGQLETLKTQDLECFKSKYKTKFNKDWSEK